MRANHCFELKVFIAEEYKEQLCDVLADLSVFDVVIGSLDCDLDAEFDPSLASLDRYAEVVRETPLVLYDEDEEKLKNIKQELECWCAEKALPASFVLAPLADQDWKDSWKKSFQPLQFAGRLVVLPPWEDKSVFHEQHKIVIDPGMAFGTGQHETTRLCLEALLALPQIPEHVLDVGTGSGILAIAARMLGARDVVGTDLDPECVRIAQENAVANGVQDIVFMCTALDELVVTQPFSLVLANIQLKPLMALVSDLLMRVTHGATLVFSGILVSEQQEFADFLQGLGVRVFECLRQNDWCALVCRYQPGY